MGIWWKSQGTALIMQNMRGDTIGQEAVWPPCILHHKWHNVARHTYCEFLQRGRRVVGKSGVRKGFGGRLRPRDRAHEPELAWWDWINSLIHYHKFKGQKDSGVSTWGYGHPQCGQSAHLSLTLNLVTRVVTDTALCQEGWAIWPGQMP